MNGVDSQSSSTPTAVRSWWSQPVSELYDSPWRKAIDVNGRVVD
jgi:hypothetical protein